MTASIRRDRAGRAGSFARPAHARSSFNGLLTIEILLLPPGRSFSIDASRSCASPWDDQSVPHSTNDPDPGDLAALSHPTRSPAPADVDTTIFLSTDGVPPAASDNENEVSWAMG